MAIRQIEELGDRHLQQLHDLYQLEWWSKGRSLEDMPQLMENSDLVVGLVEDQGERLIGFCRVLTDYMYHANVYDVIVANDFRGKGLGRRLLEAVIAHPKLQKVRCLFLCCLPEMVPFYEKWGFRTTEAELKWLRRVRSNV